MGRNVLFKEERKMENIVNKRNWWVVPVVGGILAVVVTLIQQKWMPDYDLVAFLLVIVLLGVAFFWVYTLDKQGLWWAQIPALAMVVLLATGIVAYLTPKDASGSSPFGVITLGIGAAIMGLVLKRPAAKFVLYLIAIITLLVGILMLPADLIWKILLIVVEILLIGYLIWQNNRQLPKK
jgi:hypothetical protein